MLCILLEFIRSELFLHALLKQAWGYLIFMDPLDLKLTTFKMPRIAGWKLNTYLKLFHWCKWDFKKAPIGLSLADFSFISLQWVSPPPVELIKSMLHTGWESKLWSRGFNTSLTMSLVDKLWQFNIFSFLSAIWRKGHWPALQGCCKDRGYKIYSVL